MDIVERLREGAAGWALEARTGAPTNEAEKIMADAADEIERLRAALRDALDEMMDCASHAGAPESVEWGKLRAQITVTRGVLEQKGNEK